MKLTLHGYWRSSAAYRVRIALNFKGLDYFQRSHDLRKGEQRAPAFMDIAPQGLVPVLEVGGLILTQSPAILEWLEETCPQPALLPPDPAARAQVRAMAATIGCDIHPLNNLRVLKALEMDLGASTVARETWIARWMLEGFAALERMIESCGGVFAFGDAPTLADCYLVPQAYSADRFGVDLSSFPRVLSSVETARTLQAFASAHPAVQPDAGLA